MEKKCKFFIKAIAKNIAFDVGYWDIIRNGTPTRNIDGLCYCPCAKWRNGWTESMCPHVVHDTPKWPCTVNQYMSTHDFEQHLFDVMVNEPSDVYHSLIILYLIKVYPLANTLLEFKDINAFFVNYSFTTIFFVKFYGFKNIVINGHGHVLDDEISSLQTT